MSILKVCAAIAVADFSDKPRDKRKAACVSRGYVPLGRRYQYHRSFGDLEGALDEVRWGLAQGFVVQMGDDGEALTTKPHTFEDRTFAEAYALTANNEIAPAVYLTADADDPQNLDWLAEKHTLFMEYASHRAEWREAVIGAVIVGSATEKPEHFWFEIPILITPRNAR